VHEVCPTRGLTTSLRGEHSDYCHCLDGETEAQMYLQGPMPARVGLQVQSQLCVYTMWILCSVA
jgi:hypothetical protein